MFGAEKTLQPDRETKVRGTRGRQHPKINAEIHQREGSVRALDDRGLIGVMRRGSAQRLSFERSLPESIITGRLAVIAAARFVVVVEPLVRSTDGFAIEALIADPEIYQEPREILPDSSTPDIGIRRVKAHRAMPHNESPLSGESALEVHGESTATGARLHKPPSGRRPVWVASPRRTRRGFGASPSAAFEHNWRIELGLLDLHRWETRLS